jgi:hypothetical protein
MHYCRVTTALVAAISVVVDHRESRGCRPVTLNRGRAAASPRGERKREKLVIPCKKVEFCYDVSEISERYLEERNIFFNLSR